MKRIIHFLSCIVVVFGIVAGVVAKTPVATYAASAYVQPYSDMIGQGGYIYYIRTSEKNGSAVIWRTKVANGETSKVVSEPGGIIKMVACGQQLYYTTANDDSKWEVRTCQLNGDERQTVCEGCVCDADSENIYYIRYGTGSRASLYAKDRDTGKRTAIKTVKAGQTLDYVCSIGDESYYYVYDKKADRLALYSLHTATQKMSRVAAEKRATEGTSGLLVSDVRQINGALYYDFGSYEGSGSFWNGTIRKLTAAGKKQTVAKLVSDDQIIAGSRELYFKNAKGNDYKYNLKTGKKTKYSLRFENGISYTVLGDKTYMADTSNKKKIVISRFTSGTDRETLTENFISIPFKQKAGISYAVSIKQVGIYNMICVTGRDFTDQEYGWRGKLVSIDWYITDGAGTLLSSFR